MGVVGTEGERTWEWSEALVVKGTEHGNIRDHVGSDVLSRSLGIALRHSAVVIQVVFRVVGENFPVLGILWSGGAESLEEREHRTGDRAGAGREVRGYRGHIYLDILLSNP